MIHAVELENFKGISSRQRIEFAAVTLLFGANSAGKSTILQALVYMHELLMHGRTEVDRTTLGGSVVELGGFERLVHGHDRRRALILRAEYATPASLNRAGRDLTGFPFSDLDDEIESSWIEITVQHRTSAHYTGPLITHARIGVGDIKEPLVWLEVGPTLREGEPLYARVNMGHPMMDRGIVTDANWDSVAISEEAAEQRLAAASLGANLPPLDDFAFPIFAVSRSRLSALPPLDEALRVVLPSEDEPTPEQVVALDQLRTFLEMIILGTSSQLATALDRSIYLGPLRSVPPRGLLLERTGPVMRWADGLAAWDSLLGDRSDLVQRCNAWLARIGANCRLVVQQLVHGAASAEDIADRPTDTSIRRLLLEAGGGALVLPSEVGAGVSQVVPVIVAALAQGKIPLAMIEQPELHVHPALQTGLGDLFIEASAYRRFLIETHSEHLILRLLRRIRESSARELPELAPSFSPEQISVLYVQPSDTGTTITRLRIDASGEFVDRWPRGFFEERAGELF